MIAANELRIGNWVKVKTSNDAGFYEVNEITDYIRNWATKKKNTAFIDERRITVRGGARDNEQHFESNLRPIPLTTEILLTCGFVEDEIFGYSHPILKCRWVTRKSLIGDEQLDQPYLRFDAIIKSGDTCTDIYYLHQLQNLYFALTGTELVFSDVLKMVK